MGATQQIERVRQVERIGIGESTVASPPEREPKEQSAHDAEERPRGAPPYRFDEQAPTEDGERGRNPRAALQFHE
jgi:hypothetical protein